jgi:hypothetical protein
LVEWEFGRWGLKQDIDLRDPDDGGCVAYSFAKGSAGQVRRPETPTHTPVTKQHPLRRRVRRLRRPGTVQGSPRYRAQDRAREMRIPEYWWRAIPDAEGASLAMPGNGPWFSEVSSPRSSDLIIEDGVFGTQCETNCAPARPIITYH